MLLPLGLPSFSGPATSFPSSVTSSRSLKRASHFLLLLLSSPHHNLLVSRCHISIASLLPHNHRRLDALLPQRARATNTFTIAPLSLPRTLHGAQAQPSEASAASANTPTLTHSPQVLQRWTHAGRSHPARHGGAAAPTLHLLLVAHSQALTQAQASFAVASTRRRTAEYLDFRDILASLARESVALVPVHRVQGLAAAARRRLVHRSHATRPTHHTACRSTTFAKLPRLRGRRSQDANVCLAGRQQGQQRHGHAERSADEPDNFQRLPQHSQCSSRLGTRGSSLPVATTGSIWLGSITLSTQARGQRRCTNGAQHGRLGG